MSTRASHVLTKPACCRTIHNNCSSSPHRLLTPGIRRPAATTPNAQPYAPHRRAPCWKSPRSSTPPHSGTARAVESLPFEQPPLPALAKASTALPTTPAKRYAIELISGSGEAYMLALSAPTRTPAPAARPARRPAVVPRAVRQLPGPRTGGAGNGQLADELPQRRSQVVTL